MISLPALCTATRGDPPPASHADWDPGPLRCHVSNSSKGYLGAGTHKIQSEHCVPGTLRVVLDHESEQGPMHPVAVTAPSRCWASSQGNLEPTWNSRRRAARPRAYRHSPCPHLCRNAPPLRLQPLLHISLGGGGGAQGREVCVEGGEQRVHGPWAQAVPTWTRGPGAIVSNLPKPRSKFEAIRGKPSTHIRQSERDGYK